MVEYLPDKHGKISKCGAKDPAHCSYHVGPDGRPLKHYHTVEEARKAYEASLKNNNKSTSLKKKEQDHSQIGRRFPTRGIQRSLT